MIDRVGQQLGDYRLMRLIGKGGFADVYLGEHIRRKTLTAVKVLHARLAQDNLKSFLNEARSFRLKHTHIMQILDFGLEDDTGYLVMDYAPNGSLRQRHPKGSQLPLPTIVTYVRQIADALQYAHDEGVIHRDIKPDNMLLGQNDQVLLSDFGIASIAQTVTSLNLRDQAGTVTYMAPEQLQGKPRPASDQYSLGIVVYEWICGSRPFQGTFTEIHGQHLAAPPPSLRGRVPSLPASVEEVVMTALAKDPRHRFATMHAFANALEQAYLISLPPAPTLYQQVIVPPKTAAPLEMKPVQQVPSQRSASIALPPVTDYKPLPLPPPSPLPPVLQPGSGTLSMPVASPDTYTVSRPTSGEPPASVPPAKKKRKWFFTEK
jgi:serine/threonine protein kinase